MLKGKVALITGAGQGVGQGIALAMAAKGASIAVTGRTLSKLENTCAMINEHGGKAIAIRCNVKDPTSLKHTVDKTIRQFSTIDILVNNAGYALPYAFEKNSVEDEENCIRVLGTSVISLTKLFVLNMIKNNSGIIMIVSSVAAFAPPAAIQVMYGPLKTFMNRFSEALNINYNSKGITSTALCPGYTVTNFHTASGVQDEMDSVPQFLKKSASRIAEEGVIGMLNGKKTIVPTKTWRVIVFLIKIVPQFIFHFLSGILAPGRYDN
mgnify:CR=1 FL=1